MDFFDQSKISVGYFGLVDIWDCYNDMLANSMHVHCDCRLTLIIQHFELEKYCNIAHLGFNVN